MTGRKLLLMTLIDEFGLRILRGEQHPHDLTAILLMLKDFLTDQLTLAVAIGCKPNSFGSAQCLANGLELSGLVATLRWARSVKTFRPQKVLATTASNPEQRPPVRGDRTNGPQLEEHHRSENQLRRDLAPTSTKL